MTAQRVPYKKLFRVPERGVRGRGRRVSSSGSTALCDNCCIAASRGFQPSRAGHGGSRGVHQVSETSAIEQVTLNAGDKAVTLPVARGTLGAPCIEIAKLPRETGCFTYDPGFTATASCRSAITYIDGDAGVLLYRGYPIEQLAKQSSFLEVASLLIHGELPDQKSFAAFEHDVTHHTMLHEAFKRFLGRSEEHTSE